MKISFENTNGTATLKLNGRLDTVCAQQVSADIDQHIAQAGTLNELVCDAKGLEYISSSGLRILLGLAKKVPTFRIEGVQPQVYSVLEMTGFTKIMNIERGLRQLSVDGCEIIGSGAVGTVYRIDGDTIIKVFREGTTMEEVRTEITMAKEAFVLGMPTAISYDVVQVGSQYGLVYELLQAQTLSACLSREPERIDEFARKYAQLFKQLHSISVPKGDNIPNAIERQREEVHSIARYFPKETIDLMLQILDAVPQCDRLLHLDLQTKNAMVQNNELMLIDMGEVGYGHPMLDLAHAHSAMANLIGSYEQIIGLPAELAKQMWEKAVDYYFEGLPADVVAHRKEQIEALATIRNFTWMALSDSFPEELISQCKALCAERVDNRRDHLIAVSSTFSDWTL